MEFPGCPGFHSNVVNKSFGLSIFADRLFTSQFFAASVMLVHPT